MKFRLSKFIPVRMTSHYLFRKSWWPEHAPSFPEVATWWQWRGRVFRHHRDADFDYQRARGWWV